MEHTHQHATQVARNIFSWIIPAAIFLVPAFFFPGYLNMYMAKMALFITLGVVALVSYLILLLVEGQLKLPRSLFLWALVAIGVVAILSASFTGAFFKSFVGAGIEVNTALFWITGIIFALIATFSISSVKQIYVSTFALLSTASLSILVVFFKIAASYGALPLSLFSKIPDALPGNMIDLVLILGAATIIAYNLLSAGIKGRAVNIGLWALIIVTVLVAGAMNFKPVIILLAIFSAIHFVYTAVLTRRVSFSSLAVLVASILLFIGGVTLSGFLSNKIRISSFDIRPTAGTTLSLIGTAWKGNPVFGIGPNKFSDVWNSSKPVGVNLTDFWSVNFTSGFGYLPTAAAEMGILGAVAILVFLILFLWSAGKAVFAPFESPNKRFLLLSLFLTTAYFWVAAFIYSPGMSVLALTFIETGIFAASLSILGIEEKKTINLFSNSRSNFFSVFVAVVLIILSIASGYFSWRKIIASASFDEASRLANSGSLDQSIDLVNRAMTLAPSDVYARARADLYTAKLQTLIQSIGNSPNISDEEKQDLQAFVGNGVASARSAIALDTKNYENYISLGRVYEILAQVRVDGAVESAADAYTNAEKYAPSNPSIPLAQARLAVIKGDNKEALALLDEAIAKKQNYVDAYFLKAQIAVAENDIPQATESIENATLVDPQNAGLYFQLGLLKYNQKDWRGAGLAFEKAIQIVPDYANAKYFLGLSYYELGINDQAIAVFKDLNKNNPDNAEVSLILSNLEAHKDPFASAKLPVDNKPEKRSVPPIEDGN